MIVTILGGSAPSTPWLVDWLAQHHAGTPLLVRLAGRSEHRLTAVARACRLLAAGTAIEIEHYTTEAWDRALEGVDLVLIQVRIGGLAGRHFDETFPLQYGVPGDEGLGPGGFSAAVRSWPALSNILKQVMTQAPQALPVLLTSPAGLLVRLAAVEFPDWPLAAICELPLATLLNFCRRLAVPFESLRFDYAGVNHLGWLYNLRSEGEDLIDRYLSDRTAPFLHLVERFRAVPLKYLQLHFAPAAVVREQLAHLPQRSRARELASIRSRALRTFRVGARGDILHALQARHAPWYTHAVGPLISQLAGHPAKAPYFVSFSDRNGDVRERACTFENGRFVPIAQSAPPEWLDLFVNEFAAYERQAAEAISKCDRHGLREALLAHPWMKNNCHASELASRASRHFGTFRLQEEPVECLI